MKVQQLRAIFEGQAFRSTWLDNDNNSVESSPSQLFQKGTVVSEDSGDTCDATSLGSDGHVEGGDFQFHQNQHLPKSTAHIENMCDLEGGLKKSTDDYETVSCFRSEESEMLPAPKTLVEKARERAQPVIEKSKEMESFVEEMKVVNNKKNLERRLEKIEQDARRSLHEIIGNEQHTLILQRVAAANAEVEEEQAKLARKRAEEKAAFEAAKKSAKEEKQRKKEAYEQRKRERAALKEQN